MVDGPDDGLLLGIRLGILLGALLSTLLGALLGTLLGALLGTLLGAELQVSQMFTQTNLAAGRLSSELSVCLQMVSRCSTLLLLNHAQSSILLSLFFLLNQNLSFSS